MFLSEQWQGVYFHNYFLCLFIGVLFIVKLKEFVFFCFWSMVSLGEPRCPQIWYTFFFFLVFWDTVSLCSPSCSRTHFRDQADLKLRSPPTSACRVLGSMMHHSAQPQGRVLPKVLFTQQLSIMAAVILTSFLGPCNDQVWIPLPQEGLFVLFKEQSRMLSTRHQGKQKRPNVCGSVGEWTLWVHPRHRQKRKPGMNKHHYSKKVQRKCFGK